MKHSPDGYVKANRFHVRKGDAYLMKVHEIIEHNKSLSDENSRLLSRLQKETLEKSMLLEIAKAISSTLNVQEVLNRIVDLLKKVIPYDAAGIFLLDPRTGKLQPAVLRGYDYQAIRKAKLKVGKGLVGEVAQSRKGGIFPDVSKEPKYIGARGKTRSQISVPLIAKGKLLGVINLESDKLNAFDRDDLELLTAFASHAAIAIENAQLHEQILRNRELAHELYVARRIQRALLPKKLPQIPGYDFAAVNIPSNAVSGDLYDLVLMQNGKVAIAIGDVSGKGTPAAIIMASLFSAFRTLLNEPISVAQRMTRLNEIITDSVTPGTYATFFFGELNTRTGQFTYCNAGHFPPLLVSRDGNVRKLFEGGTVLGFVKNAPYRQNEIVLEPADVLFFYTDGLIEAKNSAGAFFELDRVVELLKRYRQRPARRMVNGIVEQVREFVGNSRFEDDLTLVAVKVLEEEKTGRPE